MEKSDQQSYEARIQQILVQPASLLRDRNTAVLPQLISSIDEERKSNRKPPATYAPAVMDNYPINTKDQLDQAKDYNLPPRPMQVKEINTARIAYPPSCYGGCEWRDGKVVRTAISNITSTIRSNLNTGDDSILEDRWICELTYEQYEQRYGIKLDDIKVPPLSDTFGQVYECTASTENLKFEVKCSWLYPRDYAVTRLVYDSNTYMSVVRWNGREGPFGSGSITIWVNKNNSIFNILSIIIKCTDRIRQEWQVNYSSTFITYMRYVMDAFIHTKTITTAMNKYDSHMMVKLHRQINMIEDNYTRYDHLHIYTIWLYIAVCCNHINDDVIDVSCSMGKKGKWATDMTGKEYKVTPVHGIFIRNNLLSHINEIRNLHLSIETLSAHYGNVL